MQKYELTDNTQVVDDKTLYQIRALIDIPQYKVNAGDLGGWVEKESNLSHDGDCWVADNAMVWGNAIVWCNARVSGDAQVWCDARIWGNAVVSGNVRIRGNAWVSGNTVVSGYDAINGDMPIDLDAPISPKLECQIIDYLMNHESSFYKSVSGDMANRMKKNVMAGLPMMDGLMVDCDVYNRDIKSVGNGQ